MFYDAKKNEMRRAEGSAFVVGLVLLACVTECSAQVAIPRVNDRTQMEKMMLNHSPAALGFEPPSPPIESEQERLRKWKLREAESERERIGRLIRTVELEGLARGHAPQSRPEGEPLPSRTCVSHECTRFHSHGFRDTARDAFPILGN